MLNVRPMPSIRGHGCDIGGAALFGAGASINRPNAEGVLPLMAAAAAGSVERVLLLLEAGVELEGCGPCGTTALMVACATGQLACAIELLDRGAHVDMPNAVGVRPLMAAFASWGTCRWRCRLVEPSTAWDPMPCSPAPTLACHLSAAPSTHPNPLTLT